MKLGKALDLQAHLLWNHWKIWNPVVKQRAVCRANLVTWRGRVCLLLLTKGSSQWKKS